MTEPSNGQEGLTFALNEADEVVAVNVAGETLVLGPKDEACERMAEFLAAIDFGEQ